MTPELLAFLGLMALLILGLLTCYLYRHNKLLIKHSEDLSEMLHDRTDRIAELHIEISKKTPLCDAELQILGKPVHCLREKGHEGVHIGRIGWGDEQ